MKTTICKAEGTKRGTGWYYLLNGEKNGRLVVDVGGETWFSSSKIAREEAEIMATRMVWTKEWGWVLPV
jgi:hypothetical protein